MTIISAIQVMRGLKNHRGWGTVRGLAELEHKGLTAYRIATSWQDLNRSETASDCQPERVVMSVEAVDASEPRKDRAMS